MDVRATLDELYGAPLDRFVETRDRLAAELARAGLKDDSRALKKRRRPTPSAWATNQVVRRARVAVDDFFAAADRVRRSQAAVVAGRGGPSGYQADVDGLRRVTAALAEAGRRVLAEASRGDDRQLVDRVVENVRAAAVDEARRSELLAGELGTDLDAGDAFFGGLIVAAPSESGASSHSERQEEQQRDRDEEHARRLADARRDETAAAVDAARAEDAASAAQRRADDARARLRVAEAAVGAAREVARAAEAAALAATEDAKRAGARAHATAQTRAALEGP